MLLAGIIVTIAFVTTSLTLAQVSSLERQAASKTDSPLPAEWRFIRDRLESNLNVSINTETKNDTFHETILPAIAETFRNIQAEKGYDVVIRLAGVNGTFNKTELSLVDAGVYDSEYPINGPYVFDDAYDGYNDGILWENPCPDPVGPVGGCIAGILLFVHLTDGTSSIEEVILLAVNRG